jgi:hypothetical protein
MPATEMIDHLVGLQAQDVMPTYIALWSRLQDFEPEVISAGLENRTLNRVTLMRGTIHLVTAVDTLRLRPHFAQMLENIPFRPGFFFGATVGMDIEDVRSRAVDFFSTGPKKSAEVREWAKVQWPERDPAAVVQAAYYLLPLLQVPPRGKWKQNNRPTWASIESWLGSTLNHDYPVEELVLRYLRAFGPASTMDMQSWSRLKGFRDVVTNLGDRLRTYTDERGRVLYDTSDGELVSGEVEAPARFLGWYDNVALSHDDRSRITESMTTLTSSAEGNVSTFTLDGFISGTYKFVTTRDEARMHIVLGRSVSASEIQQLEEEGGKLLAFVEPDLRHEIVISGVASHA